MGVARYRYAHTEARLPSARIPQHILCDLQTELPTVDVGEGDTAYAKDSDKLFKRTASTWVEIGAGGASGKHIWRFAVSDPAPGNSLYPLAKSPYAGTVTKVQAIRVGSGSVSVDVEVAGVEIVGTDIVVGTTWTASAVLSAAVAIGDTVAVSLKSVVSPIGYMVVQVEVEGS